MPFPFSFCGGSQQLPILTHVEGIIALLQLHGKSPWVKLKWRPSVVCTHIGEVVGLQSFFVFYWPGGRVSAVSSAGITIQREVIESSDGTPVLQIKHIPDSRWPQSLTINTAGWLFYASGYLFVRHWHHQLMLPFIFIHYGGWAHSEIRANCDQFQQDASNRYSFYCDNMTS